jgi:hypothetical protein
MSFRLTIPRRVALQCGAARTGKAGKELGKIEHPKPIVSRACNGAQPARFSSVAPGSVIKTVVTSRMVTIPFRRVPVFATWLALAE